MAITTRQTTGTGVTAKNAPLTHAELDQNFIDLVNNGVLEISGNAINGGTSNNFSMNFALCHTNIISGTVYIPENSNALTLLPIVIPSGNTVIVGSGSTWNFLDLS